MHEAASRKARSALQRAAALFGGVSRLAFHEPLESQFRTWYEEQSRWRIRNAMWFAVGNLVLLAVTGFDPAREALFGADRQALADALRLGVVAPGAVAMLIVSFARLYRRWFCVVAQIVAPLHAASLVGLDLLMQPQGYSLSSLMPLIALAPYFLFGMLQAQATRTSAIVVAAYGLGGWFAGTSGPQHYFDLSVTAFACVLGAVMHHALQKGVRRNYLSKRRLNESANRDSLTRIHNRRMFDDHMMRLWQQAGREQAMLGLLLVDLDHFKAFNDYAGHQAGDVCLTKVAALLPAAARRPLDLAARYGGEEFAVLLYNVDRRDVEEVCRQLHARLASAAIAHPDSPVASTVTFSIGAACVQPAPDRHPDGFIQLADEALYAAKAQGRNRTVIMDREYEDLHTGVFRAGGRSAA